jgi:hypothetical protein
MQLWKALILGFVAGFFAVADLPSGSLVSPLPGGHDPARAAGMADGPSCAPRCAVRNLQIVLGRALGRGPGALLGAFKRRALLDRVDHHRRRGADADRPLRRVAAQGEPIPALWPRFCYALLVNGAWGFGAALLLRMMGAARAS